MLFIFICYIVHDHKKTVQLIIRYSSAIKVVKKSYNNKKAYVIVNHTASFSIKNLIIWLHLLCHSLNSVCVLELFSLFSQQIDFLLFLIPDIIAIIPIIIIGHINGAIIDNALLVPGLTFDTNGNDAIINTGNPQQRII